MIAGTQRRGTSLPRQRGLLAAVGATAILSTHQLLIYLSLAATVLVVAMRRGTWRGTWREVQGCGAICSPVPVDEVIGEPRRGAGLRAHVSGHGGGVRLDVFDRSSVQ